MMKLLPEEVAAIELRLHALMDLATNMYHSGQLDHDNKRRLIGISARAVEIANLMDMDMIEPNLSKRTPTG